SEFGGDEDFTDHFSDDLAAFHGVGHAAGLFPLRAHADGVPTARAKCNCQPIAESDRPAKGKGIESRNGPGGKEKPADAKESANYDVPYTVERCRDLPTACEISGHAEIGPRS